MSQDTHHESNSKEKNEIIFGYSKHATKVNDTQQCNRSPSILKAVYLLSKIHIRKKNIIMCSAVSEMATLKRYKSYGIGP